MSEATGIMGSTRQLDWGGAYTVDSIPGMLSGGWLDMRFHAAGDGWVEVSMPWKPELTASETSGILASGPIITMLDSVLGIAIWLRRGALLPQATVDLRVDYMRPALPGRTVIGRGECYRLTRSIAFVRGIAYDESPDDPVAHVVGTYMLTNA